MAIDIDQFDHPAWLTALGTGIGYGLMLALLTVVLFGLPYLLFSAL